MRSARKFSIMIFIVTLLTASYASGQGNQLPAANANEPTADYQKRSAAAQMLMAPESGILPAPESTTIGDSAVQTPLGTVPITDGIQLSNSRYTLGKDDVINVSVMRHPEVSGQYIINAEGNIQYEFIGDLKVAGYTKDELKDVLVQQLSEYIINPEVTVKIIGYNSKIIYVVGEVGAPGKIFMRGDTMTVHEALMLSGLPLLTAAGKRSLLITPALDGNADIEKVDIEALLYKGDLRQNLVMKPGDTLYVPPTFLAKTMRAISPITQPVSEAAGAGRSVYTGGF